ncbi:hypothetical protein NEAUS04_2168 [Nematocida ausubeli]|uniref:V-SNARE coiled-coil homology domain-containing protein n=1 Tax=Nematocida ausubeli (strain ATCC PRA-371 / ERTm2) TaxID=1913371 RepID=H8ZFK2_NEMA1|nr:uncharacterized protein NESG_00427 [Nematocida ausubeli]EHY64563.1 hypothetical protein NERG_02373 [Nematocida ausubeli]KAI5138029.1 hypothetical protein NEAUS07_2220 [Nematocida ausubeli]KAI5150641.1 hypothetical protein NEAUS05_2245 [Nematocida ausubeli]KAI5164388.1 hypothetical protein NEAUS04_2168 [Nematocida ausubeli]KFG27349.1 hypothetical protein NESG_00427 [Nematocida ausubeli]
MDRKVERELEDAQGEIKEAIKEEKKRGASISELEKESERMDDSLGSMQMETHAAKNRLLRKSIIWVSLCILIVLIVGSVIFLYIYEKIKALRGQ